MKESFQKFKGVVSASDGSSFQNTNLEQVWDAAEEIQNSQRQRQSMQAMSRIDLLLKRIEDYSKAIGDLQIGAIYLHWASVSHRSKVIGVLLTTRTGPHKIDASGNV